MGARTGAPWAGGRDGEGLGGPAAEAAAPWNRRLSSDGGSLEFGGARELWGAGAGVGVGRSHGGRGGSCVRGRGGSAGLAAGAEGAFRAGCEVRPEFGAGDPSSCCHRPRPGRLTSVPGRITPLQAERLGAVALGGWGGKGGLYYSIWVHV